MKSKPSFLFIMPYIYSVKYREHTTLVKLIKSRGSEMSPYSYCKRNNWTCIASNKLSTRCSKCVQCGARCDEEGPSLGDLESILKE